MELGLGEQIVWLLVLAVPVATIAWTVTHEEVFREVRKFCQRKSHSGNVCKRKFFYLFTCEYCFSHWVTLAFLLATDFHLLYPDWRGLVVSFFSLVWVANIYMSLMSRVRVDIRHERAQAKVREKQHGKTDSGKLGPEPPPASEDERKAA